MAIFDATVTRTERDFLEDEFEADLWHDDLQSERRRRNVGGGERAASIGAGAILALIGAGRRTLPGMLVAGLGGALLYRGATGYCPAYGAMGVDTAEDRDVESELLVDGIHVEQAMSINRSTEELYRFWRDFSNLPRVMSHLQSVEVLDGQRSRWTANAPKIAGGSVTWEAEITADEPNSRIAWRSLPDSDIDCAGEVRFAKGLGDRGTEVHVTMEYLPPAGRAGHLVAKLFGDAPWRQIREDLRDLKRELETGCRPTTEGQPTGNCP